MTAVTRRDVVFLSLAGVFVTNAILGEVIGGKLIQIGPFRMSIGVIPWPIVFVTSDLVNEFFGRDGVRRLTFVTVALILYAFVVLFAGMQVPAAGFSPVNDSVFRTVFGQSLWIIAGSVTAFLVSQMVDVVVFWVFRDRTGGRHLWLRATGSTVVSQLVDSFVIIGIAFWLPGKLGLADFLGVAGTNYLYKILIAVCMTPLVYLGHAVVDRFLGEQLAHELIEESIRRSHGAGINSL